MLQKKYLQTAETNESPSFGYTFEEIMDLWFGDSSLPLPPPSPLASLSFPQAEGGASAPSRAGFISNVVGSQHTPPLPITQKRSVSSYAQLLLPPDLSVHKKRNTDGYTLDNFHVDFSERLDPKNGVENYLITHRDNTFTAISEFLGSPKKDVLTNMGLGFDSGNGRAFVIKLLENLSKGVDWDEEDRKIFKKAQYSQHGLGKIYPGIARKQFMDCFFRGIGIGGILKTGVKFQKIGCGQPFCPFCSQSEQKYITKKIFSEIFAIAMAARIPTLGTFVFSLPMELGQRWARDHIKIQQLSDIIVKLLRKLYGFKTQDSLSVLISPHLMGDGDIMTDRLHFHCLVLPVAIRTYKKGPKTGIKYARISAVSHFKKNVLIQLRNDWRNEIISKCNDISSDSFPENFNINYNFIPIISFDSQSLEAPKYELQEWKEKQMGEIYPNSNLFYSKKNPNDRYKSQETPSGDKIETEGFKHQYEIGRILHRFHYDTRDFMYEFTEKPIAWDENGVVVPTNGWTSATGYTWDEYTNRAIESLDRENCRLYGLFKRRKAHMRSLGVGIEENEEPIAEVRTRFKRNFGKKYMQKQGGGNTIRLVDNWEARFEDETKEEFVNIEYSGVTDSKFIVDYESWRENCKEKEGGKSNNPYNNGDPYPYEKSYFIPETSVAMCISFSQYGENAKYEEREEDLARYAYYENKVLKEKKQHEINIKKIADDHKNRNNFYKTWRGKFQSIAGFSAEIDAIGGIIFPTGIIPLCGFNQLNDWLNKNGNSLLKEIKKELKNSVSNFAQEQYSFNFSA